MGARELSRRLIDGFTMFIVTALSLLLLLYVSYGDAKRTYEQLHIEKMTAHGLLLQNSVEKFLRDGLPLKQYAGFNALAGPLVERDDLDALIIYDQSARKVFEVIDKRHPTLPDSSEIVKANKRDIQVQHTETHFQVIVPLRSRFETVGSLVISSPTWVVSKRLSEAFTPLLYVGVGLSAVFSLVLLFVLPYFARSGLPWLQIGYGVTFSLMAAAVISTLVSLYYNGIQDKSKASAVTLSQRLNDLVAFQINLKDIEGLNRAFSEFRRVNPEINEAALIEDGAVRIATDANKVGRNWESDRRNFEYKIGLSNGEVPRRVDLAVTVPRDVIVERVFTSVKNFAALFIACAFLAGLFLQVAASLQGLRAGKETEGVSAVAAGDAALIIVKPVFFLAVFLDSLTYSFLPRFMQETALAGGASAAYASVPFTAYYLCFALSLLPAGNLAERYGAKPLILGGMLLAGFGVAGMIVPMGIETLTAVRGVAGIGQGLLLIGVQTYILAVASPEKKTQGNAIIVFGFQGGMISGMALGSLIVNYLQPAGVFAAAGGVALIAILYTLMLLPRAEPKQAAKAGLGAAVRKLGTDIKSVVTSIEFLKTLFCIGAPAKAILTGTITFAMPLLLGQYGYRTEDIGQIIMLYGLGVIAATGYASRLVDRTKNAQSVLFWGAVMSAAGLVMIGTMGSAAIGNGHLSTALVIAGTMLVGLAHGFINAPVVTHVGQSETAKRVGAVPVATSYRFLERGGHVAGPFIMAQLFLLGGQSAHVIAWMGIAIGVLGLLFILGLPRRAPRVVAPEAAR